MQKMHPAYLAGIIDGEGSIMMVRTGNAMMGDLYTSWTARVQIANTDLNLLNAIMESYGGAIEKSQPADERRNWKAGYRVYWRGMNAVEVLSTVRPYLISKASQADVLAEAMEARVAGGGKGVRKTPELVAYLNECAGQIKAMNKRGLN